MNITITFRHMDGTEAVKKYAHEKIAKLQKFLRQAMSAQVTLTVEGLEHSAEVNIQSGGGHFHATEKGTDLYASIDMVHDKLERQIRAAKDHDVTRRRSGESVRELIPEEAPTHGSNRKS
ncbi:MAG: ribosome-associated translation inhibitor RaiA [Polyangiaceae bacterium]|nr:ribosome-associated translation inhibitor RaiA [Polyangiaceae bacterium]